MLVKNSFASGSVINDLYFLFSAAGEYELFLLSAADHPAGDYLYTDIDSLVLPDFLSRDPSFFAH